MYKKITLTIVLTITCFLFAKTASAEVIVIVNKNSKVVSLSKTDLKKIFMMKKKQWNNGESIKAVNLGKKNQTRGQFSKTILNKSVSKLESFYTMHVLTGKGLPPKVLKTEEEVIQYIVEKKNGIGYISKPDSRVKTVNIK